MYVPTMIANLFLYKTKYDNYLEICNEFILKCIFLL